ncbi:hypothetical protein ACFVYJ_05385 [Pontibacter sp. JAM-7]|uniref:hypothetical protein n=1 Tax=Pontibacter sp. JAM-7 TaxID=3366581 RepID=UPI003AF6B246
MDLICIDLEASGLSTDSYPIEVAWKNAITGQSDNFLINPESAADWDHWDEFAEEVHGIDRELLCLDGVDIYTACEKLRALAGKRVISDAVQFDHFWLSRLYAAAEETMPFRLVGLEELLNEKQLVAYSVLTKGQHRRHRAKQDVDDILANITLLLENGTA